MKHGVGVHHWVSGYHYVGEFKFDLMDGNGKYDFQNGDKYEGSFS